MLTVLMLLSCALTGPVPAPAAEALAASAFERDRAAILAMAGTFDVDFRFEETVGLEPGYELTDPYTAEAHELVLVAEDHGDHIVLQHILVVGGEESGDEPRVIKHWRQEWTYQDTELTVYRGHDTWEHVVLPAEIVRGTWTQAVYQVNDAPRYEAHGSWDHTGGTSSWESAPTWRPLPRREYTRRSDYHVVVCRNRHTITPDGWVHEQANAKLVLTEDGRPDRYVAHETGLNRYAVDDDFDFGPAMTYWEAHDEFWLDVRAAWASVLDDAPRVRIEKKVDGERLSSVLRSILEAGDRDPARRSRETIEQRIRGFVARAD